MVALSLTCLVMGTTELISIKIDSEKTVKELKDAVRAAAPSLTQYDASLLRLYLSKNPPEAKSREHVEWRRLELKVLDGEQVLSETDGHKPPTTERCLAMKSSERLDSFQGHFEKADGNTPHVIAQHPRWVGWTREDVRWLAIGALLSSSILLMLWLPLVLSSDFRGDMSGGSFAWSKTVWIMAAMLLGFPAWVVLLSVCCMWCVYGVLVMMPYSKPPVTVDGVYRRMD